MSTKRTVFLVEEIDGITATYTWEHHASVFGDGRGLARWLAAFEREPNDPAECWGKVVEYPVERGADPSPPKRVVKLLKDNFRLTVPAIKRGWEE